MKKDVKRSNSKWNKFLKIFGTSTLAVAMALSLTGCGTKTTTVAPKQLVVWGFVDEDVFKPIIRDFNNTHKDITVKYYKKTLDSSYEDAALNSILSGQGPDVWAIPNDWVYRHKDKLATAPDTLLKTKKVVPKDYFADFVMTDSAFDNKLYAMPPSTDALQIYYNQQLLNSASDRARKALRGDPNSQTISNILNILPATWEEFDKIVPWLTVKNGSNIQVGGAAIGTSNNVSYSQDVLSLLMLQNQTKMISADLSQSTFNLPIKNPTNTDVFSGKNSLDFYAKYSNPSSPQYTWNSSMPNDVDAFIQGKVTAIFAYSNLANHLQQAYPNLAFKRGLVPQVGDFNPIVDYAHYTTYTVPQASVASSLAWEFVIGLATNPSATYKSTTKELSAKKFQGQEPILKVRATSTTPSDNLIPTMTTWNKGRYPVEVDIQLKQSVDRVVAGSQSSQASLDTAAANVTELLRKQTW